MCFYSPFSNPQFNLCLTLGNYEIVAMLLRKGGDPYISVNTSSFSPGSRGFGNAFAAAAAHGHKNVLRKLLAEPGARRENDMLSLAEILSEGLYVLFYCFCFVKHLAKLK